MLIVLLLLLTSSTATNAKEPNPTQIAETITSEGSAWLRHTDSEYDISFEYPGNWSVEQFVDAEVGYRELNITNSSFASIVITRDHNPELLTPDQWFERVKSKYHQEAITTFTIPSLPENKSIFIAQPESCKTAPMIVAIIASSDYIFTVSFYEKASRASAVELEHLLATLEISGQLMSNSFIGSEYFQFPVQPVNTDCSPGDLIQGFNEPAATSARKCAGADMYIPTEGKMNVPWKCFDNHSFCDPYYPRSNPVDCGLNNIWCEPHSGIDIMGGQGPGVTPVYATYSGLARVIANSNGLKFAIRIEFSGPHTGYYAYMSHMAHGTASYVGVSDGQSVVAGQLIGYQGDYGTTTVHLHVSYNDAATDTWSINTTENPATFLKAKYLKYDDGWDHTGMPVTCVDTVGSGAVDVFLLVDLTASFQDDLPKFKSQAPSIIATLKANNPNTRFGLGAFEDYPISPFGSIGYGDTAYRRIVDLTTDSAVIINAINGLTTRNGADLPESQLPALFQAATGAGQDLAWLGYPNASIPPNQGASFRKDAEKMILLWTDAPFHNPGDPGLINYPGPSKIQVASALFEAGITCNFDPCPSSGLSENSFSVLEHRIAVDNDESGPRTMVMGITSGGGGTGDLEKMARLTGAIAPEGGTDCDADGIVDIEYGNPLVCGISSTGEGIGAAIIALVEAAARPGDFNLYMTENGGTLRRVDQATGATTVVGNLGINSIDGLSNRPGDTTSIYGVYYLPLGPSGLARINLRTGEATPFPVFDGSILGISNSLATAVAISPAAPNIAVVAGSDINNANHFYIWKVDVDTGLVLGAAVPTTDWLLDLTYSLDGSVLYGTNDNGQLVTVNSDTGVVTLVGDPRLSDFIEGLAFRPSDGELFAIDAFDRDRLVRLDPTNGNVLEVIGELGVVGPYGLVFIPSNQLTVNVSGTGSGIVISNPVAINCGLTCTHNFNLNTVITLTATASPGSTFTGWSGGGCIGNGTCTVQMSSAVTVTANFTLTTSQTFEDVASSYWASDYIKRLYSAGITGGCASNPLRYCPEATVTRSQMAVFLLRGIHGSSYNPPTVGGSTGFGDVATTHWAAAWIKQLAAEGITGGCGAGNFCPENPVTRAQMAVFLLRSKYGAGYNPPAVGSSAGFSDVQPSYWAGAWIKQLVAEGITAGCGSGNYCPENPVTRAQMAVFLVRTFNLP
jgi:hypothetical protein